MANEPEAPAQLCRSLNERLENSDKEGEIELYYELLSSGRSVGEILNEVGHVQGGAAQTDAVAAEPARPELGEAQIGVAAEAAVVGDSRRRFRYGRLPGVATSIAFWALYRGAVACASIAGFSLLRGVRDTQPTIVGEQSQASDRTEAASAADRPAAVPEVAEPRPRLVVATGLRPPQANPDAAGPGLLQPLVAGSREPVSTAARDAMAPPPQSDTGPPDAIGQLIMQLTAAAEAPPDAATEPATSIGLSASDTGRNTGDTPLAASADEAKAAATAPSGGLPAAPAGKGRKAHAPRRDARSRHAAGLRHSARNPRSETIAEHKPAGPDRGNAAPDIDVARGYGQGAYGPAPYSETGY
jgi:hypothetical protein